MRTRRAIDNKDQTAYNLSKELNMALSTLQKLISSMFEDGFLVKEGKIEKGRLKKLIRIKKANEFVIADISEKAPDLKEIIEIVLSKGISVWIHQVDGTKIELRPK